MTPTEACGIPGKMSMGWARHSKEHSIHAPRHRTKRRAAAKLPSPACVRSTRHQQTQRSRS
eukprot:8195424-Alexandrium_andersonii.AAC.1